MSTESETEAFSWRREWCWALLPVALAVGVRLACLPYLEVAWDGDGANSCLLALHHSQGRMPAFWYSQSYNGSVEGLLAAPFVLLMGPTVQAMGLAMTLLAGVLVALLYRVGWEVAGGGAAGRAGALVGCVGYASCSLPLVDNLSGLNHSYTMTAVLGVAVLFAGRRFLARPTALGALGLGALVGFGLFNNPQIVSFVAPIVVTLWLRGEVVPRLLGRSPGGVLAVRASVGALGATLALTIGLAAAGVASIDVGGFELSMSNPGRNVMRLVLLTAAVLGLLELVLAPALGRLIWLGACGAAGGLIGLTPMIWFKVHNAIHGVEVMGSPSGLDPTNLPRHLHALVTGQGGEILFNQMAGIRYMPTKLYYVGVHVWMVWLGAALLGLMALGQLVARRRVWGRLVTLQRPEGADLPWLLSLHLLAVVAMYGMFPRHDVYPKYFHAALVPIAALVAASAGWLWRWRRVALVVAGPLWLGVHVSVSTATLIQLRERWADPRAEWREVHQVMDLIQAGGASRGYANYWYGFKINYLSGDQLILREWPRDAMPGWAGQRPMLPRYHRAVARAVEDGERVVFFIGRQGDDEVQARVWFDRYWRRRRVRVVRELRMPTYILYFCRPL